MAETTGVVSDSAEGKRTKGPEGPGRAGERSGMSMSPPNSSEDERGEPRQQRRGQDRASPRGQEETRPSTSEGSEHKGRKD